MSAPAPSVRIVVADEHELARRGIVAILQKRPGWAVVAQASSGAEAVELCRAIAPEIVILSLNMPAPEEVGLLRELASASPGTRAIVLSLECDVEFGRATLNAGARAFVCKSDPAGDLADAVGRVLEGLPYLTPQLTEAAIRAFTTGTTDSPTRAAGGPELTPREIEVVRLVAAGATNREIAHALAISVRTVESHRSKLMQKLRVNSVCDLVLYAVRNGLGPAESPLASE